MQTMKITGLLLIACVLAVAALVLIKVAPHVAPAPFAPVITNFDECVKAGNPVMESYPRQCRTKDGVLYVEEVGDVPESDSIVSNGCAVAGCSSQLCVSEQEAPTIVTTCEFLAEYACYRNAACEPQPDGKCGWTPTAELKQCLANPPAAEGELQTQLEVM